MRLNILLVFLSLFLTLFILEIFLILVDYGRPHLSRWDMDGGVRHFESQSGYYVKESKQFITINSQGIRVPNDKKNYQYFLKKASDTFRILIFGDSMAEGLQVTFYERFSHVMETELNNCKYKPKDKVEIINFALSGTGQARQFEMQQGFAKNYETDIILAVAHSNDPRNNYSKLEPGVFYPYWTLENGNINIDTSFRSNEVFLKKLKYSNLRMKIVNQSRVLQLLTQGYEVYLKNKRIKSQKNYYKELYGKSTPYWLTPDWNRDQFVMVQMLQALGQPMAVVSMLFLATSVVRPSEGPYVSGTINTLRALGSLIGGAVVGQFLTVRGRFHGEMLLDHAALAESSLSSVPEPSQLMGIIGQQALVLSVADAYRALGVLALILIPFVLRLTYIPAPDLKASTSLSSSS